jgi:carbonic anhydrase
MGHSSCGGVRGCHDMCSGHAPELEEKTSFVGRWMDILRPGYERVGSISDETQRVAALERQAVRISLENLMTFPFVVEAVKEERLTLHGLWHDIGAGGLEYLDGASDEFVAI